MAAEIADPALALSDISDDNLFVEVKAEFAKEMVLVSSGEMALQSVQLLTEQLFL